MVYISKVYTKFGDRGDTMLASGDTVGKDTLRVAAYGEVDELNAVIGVLRVEISRVGERREFLAALDASLARVQQELFDLGAELATPGATEGKAPLRVEEADITRLEQELDAWNADLPPLRSFILPGGGPLGAHAHLARTVCRRAERTVVALTRVEPVRAEAVRYINRLSDWFFVVARAAAHAFDVPEVLWDTHRRNPAP
ncbi:cob(I)alamin adenosyltransferase [Nannocystis exedens]|uniref:Corrinoid adenosyltransferase n=1 Tax=Nannocystis exedens TaxID=54 RepID=A0A1I2H603_9BACT|nr:cob(I)yrinic acid a,c-diamide adenosyltransferase [Nannocystis exedens]PCC75817.1 Cob(I)yrinic acid a,c-diamide adenosyltransferase [Nannocystis exedens]SFF25605.1 cob(I)alamin adenosyltransferase [Nannocystis exedens]